MPANLWLKKTPTSEHKCILRLTCITDNSDTTPVLHAPVQSAHRPRELVAFNFCYVGASSAQQQTDKRTRYALGY